MAVAVDITLNRYGDHDPQGRAFVLADRVPDVRRAEAAARAARVGTGPVPVSLGLQSDALQPLTLRVRPGECLRIVLRNEVPLEPVSFHLHGIPLVVAATGRAATEREPSAVAAVGGTVTYEWAVPAHEPEGSHYAHSHGLARPQTEHGLYAAVVVEPSGSTWLDPRSGVPEKSGWDAVVVRRDGTSFREFALFYAEDGDEPYQPLDRHNAFVPLVDPLTNSYKPSARWLNYRSEPFYNRLQLAQHVSGRYDESTAYSSYSFGDPATPMMRSYVGDPVVQRVIHAGSEVLHVHHVHGGSTRWRRQPGEGDTGATLGLTKFPPLLPGPSERTDSQTLAPSETFDAVDECGSGGCQQSVGDFLWHCHVAHHYFAGMWGLWRVYGTLQDGASSTDSLPALLPLPDRRSAVHAAVPASRLIGTTVTLAGHPTMVTPAVLQRWLGRVLPPPGIRRGYDAGVWNWTRKGQDVLGEPEDSRVWPGYRSATPGQRPEVLFEPTTGRPAYPMLRPHLASRPPFAAGHGPAPYLDPADGARLPAPGADGPQSICPTGASSVRLPVTALEVPIQLSQRADLVDPHGELFVPDADLAAVQADPARRRPLVVRARAQRDCVDATLTSALHDDDESYGLSKVNLHIHFVQFDVQGSDGVDAGFNPEQSIRPWRSDSVRLAAPAVAGARSLTFVGLPLCRVGETVALGPERATGPEVVQITAVHGSTVQLRDPLASDHPAGEPSTREFVRYRYWPDAQTGTAYFHDHVNALASWKHGLFGALVIEPPDATWTDPTTGAGLSSGPVADITTKGSVGVDEHGSFRELVALLQDDIPINQSQQSTGGALGMRAEPLSARGGPVSQVFSDAGHGPAQTQTVRAYVGDPVVLRTLVPGTNDVHSLFVDGHWFRREPWSRQSQPTDTVHVGISERYDVVLPAAGGPGGRPGDYLFGDGRTSKLREGAWGVLRVLPGPTNSSLRPLAGRAPPPSSPLGSVCPSGAPVRTADVTALELALPMLDGGLGRAFIPTDRVGLVRARPALAEPLTLHVRVGDCLRVLLRNALSASRVSLHAGLLAGDPARAGLAVGSDPDSTVAPGASGSFEYWASPAVGEGVGLLRDGGDPVEGPVHGLYGAVVVAARGARFVDPHSGKQLAGAAPGAQVVVLPASGKAYRDATLFLQDSDGALGTHQMPYLHVVLGAQGISYQHASTGLGDPPTPLLEAYVGDPLRLHVLSPVSEQAQAFALDGHRWPLEPGRRGSAVVAAVAVAGHEAVTVQPLGGAGGEGHKPGDYVYSDTRAPYRDAGMWGVLRVYPRGAHTALRTFPAVGGHRKGPWVAVGAGLLMLLTGGWLWRRRSRSAHAA